MPEVPYVEKILSTANTKFAAVLLTFGKKLRSHLPLDWNIEFASKTDYYAWRRNKNSVNPKTQVSFNFDSAGLDGQTIFAAFQNHHAEDAYNEVAQSAISDPKVLAELKAAHSAAVANACCQALQAREFLIKLLKQVPDDSKWVTVRGNGDAFVRFGLNSSKETVAEFIDKL